jgi:hypothetical protein
MTIPVGSVSGLTAVGGVRAITLEWAEDDVHGNGQGLSYKAIRTVEIHATQTNDRTTATQKAAGRKRANYETGDEYKIWYNWGRPLFEDGTYGAWYPANANAGISARTTAASDASYALQNGQIVITRPGGNTSKAAIKTLAGADPSPSDPVYTSFSNSSGGYDLERIDYAVDFTFSNGSSAGFVSGDPSSLWYAIYRLAAGSVVFGAAKCTEANQVLVGLSEFALDQSTTAEGGAGGADTAGIFYTMTAVSAKPSRVVGFADWDSGPTSPGAADPTRIVNYRAGMPLAGQELPGIPLSTFSTGSGTTLIPNDNTKPQITEGNLLWSATLNSRPANLVLTQILGMPFSYTVNAFVTVAVFWGTGTDCKGAKQYSATANFLDELTWAFVQRLGVAGATSYSVRIGGDVAGTFNLNPNGGGTLGGTIASFFKTSLIMG